MTLDERLQEHGRRITEEMAGRLETELPEKDRTAVIAAVQKALIAGAQAGAMELAARRKSDPDASPVQLNWELPRGDAWDQEYGEGA